MRARWADVAVGAALALGLGAAFPIGVAVVASHPKPDLEVHAPASHAVAGAGAREPVATTSAADGVLAGEIDLAKPGLGFKTWRATFGSRWEREVSLPTLVGPFEPLGAPWSCGIAVRLRPGFFSDEAGHGGVSELVATQIRGRFPFTVEGLTFPAVASTEIRLAFAGGHAVARAHVHLADGTLFDVSVPLTVKATPDGEISVGAGSSRLAWSGPTRVAAAGTVGGTRGAALGDRFGELGRSLGRGVGAWVGRTFFESRVDAIAEQQANAILAGALADLHLRLPTLHPFDGRPGDAVALRLCADPVLDDNGATFLLRPTVTLRAPRVDDTVAGPVRMDLAPVFPDVPATPANVEAVITAGAVNEALFAVWQSGTLRDEWARSSLAAKLREARISGDVRASDLLPFELDRVVPRLPPIVLPEKSAGGSFEVRVADVAFGERDGATVVGHFDVRAAVTADDGAIRVRGEIASPRAGCVTNDVPGVVLSPCFSDVLPLLRERLAAQPIVFEWVDRTLLARLSRLDLASFDVTLASARVATFHAPSQLYVSAVATVTPR